MRIDYSEPKQSYVTGQNRPRPRKEPIGLLTVMVVITGIIMFIAGFGAGWFFSHKATIKSFQAATSQTSLENSPKVVEPQIAPPPQQQPPASQPGTPGSSVAASPTGTQTPPEPALSFYKTLPSGQKNTALGSGINTEIKEKQPLQAAIPSNVARQLTSETPQPTAEKPVTPSPEKSAAKPVEGKFTVQLASFSLKSEAETLKNKLAGKGYNAHINESNQGDKGIWYRVRVGRKLEQEAAKELAAKLGRTAIVIPD